MKSNQYKTKSIIKQDEIKSKQIRISESLICLLLKKYYLPQKKVNSLKYQLAGQTRSTIC